MTATRITLYISIIILLLIFQNVNTQTYNDSNTLIKKLLDPNVYDPDVIPIYNQSKPISVSVTFGLISIVQVDEITQAFISNGVFSFTWTDEVSFYFFLKFDTFVWRDIS